jgi:hypothetical protein
MGVFTKKRPLHPKPDTVPQGQIQKIMDASDKANESLVKAVSEHAAIRNQALREVLELIEAEKYDPRSEHFTDCTFMTEPEFHICNADKLAAKIAAMRKI